MSVADRPEDSRPPATARNGEDRSAAELERDIGRIRSQLDRTIAEIEDRLSPNRIIDNFFGRMKGGTGAFAGNLGKQVLRHPVPSALFAAGLGWLLFAERGDKARRQNGDASTQAGIKADRTDRPRPVPLRETARSRPYAIRETLPALPRPEPSRSGLLGRFSKANHSGGERHMSGYRDASQDWEGRYDTGSSSGHYGSSGESGRFQQVGNLARDQVARARTGFEHMLEDQPLVLGAVAVALGAVLGATLPTTRVENRYLGPKRDQLQDRATEFAREQWERAKQAALTAGSAAREEAERALSSQESGGKAGGMGGD